MNANDLKKRVEIWKYDRSTNASGTPVEKFKLYKYTYASIKLLNGNLSEVVAGTVPETQVEILLRHDPIIDYNCKIVYLNNSYRINYIEEPIQKGFLRLKCTVYNENQPKGNG